MKTNLGFASLLAASGVPMPRRSALSAAGVRRFGFGWRERVPGSRGELAARFALLDPAVKLEFHSEHGDDWAVGVPVGRAALGCRPRRRRVRVHTRWADSTLPGRFPELTAWCRAVANDWLPTEFDELRLAHHWCDGLGVTASGGAILNPEPVPMPVTHSGGRAVVAIGGEPRLVEAGQLIVGDLARGRFLLNTQPFVPAWRAEASGWIALRRTDRLTAAAAEAGNLEWRIDGRPVRPAWTRAGMAGLILDEPVEPRHRVTVEAYNTSGTSIRVLPNAVPMRVVDLDPNGGTPRPAVLTGAVPAGTCETLLDGAVGLHSSVQLAAAVPTTDLLYEPLLRHCDLRRRLAADLPDLRSVVIENTVAQFDLAFRRRLRVTIDPPNDTAVPGRAWQNAVRTLLTPRIPEPWSLEVSLHEESP